ncbi:hypothetical protein [Vallitalea sp.]|jgi:hypothetical protein|uniref:hypothetical protein n=1 Tax=Vallitalea sp. TaxID=1882829 RepID=UPI0025F8ADCA|nr:hypothetical protein [Vallitalea sp.]MCT4687112.1 hypothetical protein [Vallitalea sp.]
MKLSVMKVMPRIIICLYIMCSFIFFSGCRNGDADFSNNTNFSQLYGNSDFSVVLDESETSANGSILIYEKEQNILGIKIVALVSIDATDWGGIAFQIPNGCYLDDMLCTYPDDLETINNVDLIDFWVTGNEDVEYGSAIEIGRSRNQEQSEGGDGTVVIDFSYPYDDINTINELKFGIECGASYENGNIIWGIGYDEIVVEINPLIKKGEVK